VGLLPQHTSLLEEASSSNDDNAEGSVLVRLRGQWRKEMAKWVRSEREGGDDDSSTVTVPGTQGRHPAKWLPQSFELLFGGRQETPIEQQMLQARREKAYTEEARLMELLVDEEEGETIPDDDELEGSGDDFDG